MLVYLSGDYIDHAAARVSVDDRGFVFADGIYEVARVYEGRAFLMEPHLRRMERGLRALRIDLPDIDILADIGERLLDENALRSGDATIYMQVTRGAAVRKHAFPKGAVPPTVYLAARRFQPPPSGYFSEGVAAITVPDTRWTRCDIKSISLLPNVLANQAAREAGAFEALFVRGGAVIEGSHTNLFGVMDGTVYTYPACNFILAGITRGLACELAAELGIPLRLEPMYLDRLFDAEELFLTGTTAEIMPVVNVDGRPIGTGRPGPVTRRLHQAYLERV